MTKLFLKIDSYTDVTREADPDDEWSGEDTSTSHTFGEAYLVPEGKSMPWRMTGDYHPISDDYKRGDTVYIVVAVWSTGDSFNRNDGEGVEVMGVYKDKATARNIGQELEDADTNNEANAHLPWHGYFENLDYIEVLERQLKGIKRVK